MEALKWSVNPKVLLDLKDNLVGSSTIKNCDKDDQDKLTQSISVSNKMTKDIQKGVGTHIPIQTSNAHTMKNHPTDTLP